MARNSKKHNTQQEISHGTLESIRKNPTRRFVLKAFVWILAISIVSTIGVTWDEMSFSGPIVLSTKNGNIDLSPRGLYMMEYDRLGQEARQRYTNTDPRVLDNFLLQVTLTNTAELAVRQEFYRDIGIKPSDQTRNAYRDQGLVDSMIDLQYGETAFFDQLGVAQAIGAPTIADIYSLDSYRTFSLAAELLVLNKTNFFISKISDEEKEAYYAENYDRWLSEVVVSDYIVSNRGQARKLINFLREEGVSNATAQLNNDEWTNKVVYTPRLTVISDASNFDFFEEILESYQNKNSDDNYVISEPIYVDGQYHVTVLSNIYTYSQLDFATQRDMFVELVAKQYRNFEREYASEWQTLIRTVQDRVANNDSYSAIANEIQGVVNHTLSPFTLYSESFTSVIGESVSLPLLKSKKAIEALLNTELAESSDLVDVSSNTIQMAIRPLSREFQTNRSNSQAITQDFQLYQFANQFKSRLIQRSFSDEYKKNLYDLKVYPATLTNLIN